MADEPEDYYDDEDAYDRPMSRRSYHRHAPSQGARSRLASAVQLGPWMKPLVGGGLVLALVIIFATYFIYLRPLAINAHLAEVHERLEQSEEKMREELLSLHQQRDELEAEIQVLSNRRDVAQRDVRGQSSSLAQAAAKELAELERRLLEKDKTILKLQQEIAQLQARIASIAKGSGEGNNLLSLHNALQKCDQEREQMQSALGQQQQQMAQMRQQLQSANSNSSGQNFGPRRNAAASNGGGGSLPNGQPRPQARPPVNVDPQLARAFDDCQSDAREVVAENRKLRQEVARLKKSGGGGKPAASSPAPSESAEAKSLNLSRSEQETMARERRRFVIEEYINKVAILANRNAVHLAFTRTLIQAAESYEDKTSVFPEGHLKKEFLLHYPKVEDIQVLPNGRTILEAQLQSVEFELLPPQEQEILRGRIMEIINGNPEIFNQSLVLDVSDKVTEEDLNREVARLEQAFGAFFGALGELRTALLSSI